jgi:hypothetical protein
MKRFLFASALENLCKLLRIIPFAAVPRGCPELHRMGPLLCLLFCLGSTALAQFSYRGDVSLGATTTYANVDVDLPKGQMTRVDNAGFQVTLKGHLEADLTFDSLGFFAVLDPNVTVNDKSEIDGDIGLTEMYGRYQRGEFDISAGFERLPLETARLSVPFSLSEVSSKNVSADSPKGSLEGIWGARVLWYPGDYRFRLASFYRADDEQFGVALSAKRFFGDFELEATAIYDNHFTFGLNGSGLLGDIVVYGETWLLLNTPLTDGTETSFRGMVGATGYLGDSLWTLEAGYFPNFASRSSFPQLLAQWQLPQDNMTWSIGGGAGLQDETIVGLVAASIGVSEDNLSSSFSLLTQLSADVIAISVGFEIKGAF